MPSYIVTVRRGPLSGFARGQQRLNILPGDYEVLHEGGVLVFRNADSRGGDIRVMFSDYPELQNFPDIPLGQQIAIKSTRQP